MHQASPQFWNRATKLASSVYRAGSDSEKQRVYILTDNPLIINHIILCYLTKIYTGTAAESLQDKWLSFDKYPMQLAKRLPPQKITIQFAEQDLGLWRLGVAVRSR